MINVDLDELYEKFHSEIEAKMPIGNYDKKLQEKDKEIRRLYGKLAFQKGYDEGFVVAMKYCNDQLKGISE